MAEKLSRQTGHCRAADGGLLTNMVWQLLELLVLGLEEVMVEEVAARGEGIYLYQRFLQIRSKAAMVGEGESVRSMVLSSLEGDESWTWGELLAGVSCGSVTGAGLGTDWEVGTSLPRRRERMIEEREAGAGGESCTWEVAGVSSAEGPTSCETVTGTVTGSGLGTNWPVGTVLFPDLSPWPLRPLLVEERGRDTWEICLAALALRRALDLRAPPPVVSVGMEELPRLIGGSRPCDLRRLVLMVGTWRRMETLLISYL